MTKYSLSDQRSLEDLCLMSTDALLRSQTHKWLDNRRAQRATIDSHTF